MKISRLVIKNYRSLKDVDVSFAENATAIIGENNTGKSNFLHAIRLCLDVNLSSTYRSLLPHDVHSSVDQKRPFQVLIGVEFSDFEGNVNQEALLHGSQINEDRARIFYRYRPKPVARAELDAGNLQEDQLTRDDYRWEIYGGGDEGVDLADLTWDQDIGASIRFEDLQSYLVVFLTDLRDVETDLKNIRNSPLAKLIKANEISEEEQAALVDVFSGANTEIEKSPTIKAIGKSIAKSIEDAVGPAFQIGVDVGLTEPTFHSIVRSLKLLLTNGAAEKFDPSLNGLGLNNILYISILIEYFNKRVGQNKSAGQIILFEEPEAHLHPQIQMTLYTTLRDLQFQSILTTHSTHITAQAKIASFVSMTNCGANPTSVTTLSKNSDLKPNEREDLERFLDATKSDLLYARKVMLVEGPSELFLIPPLVKKVRGIDLEREGISVVAIHGVHFDIYAKLFSKKGLPKKCAIVADADLEPNDMEEVEDEDIDVELIRPDLQALASDYVGIFLGETTFERELAYRGNLLMLSEAAGELGAPVISKKLKGGHDHLQAFESGTPEYIAVQNKLGASTLNTAKRFGKARFAQVASRKIGHAEFLPKYIDEAVTWLLQ
ncbi:MAG: AAA family ATPase [Alphaproteobacteria bacterium]